MATQTATITKKVTSGGELIVIKKNESSLFRKRDEETKDALARVRRGREDYRTGKTVMRIFSE